LVLGPPNKQVLNLLTKVIGGGLGKL
jgi:hypothetical protein